MRIRPLSTVQSQQPTAKLQAASHKLQEPEAWSLQPERWTVDRGRWTIRGLWTMVCGLSFMLGLSSHATAESLVDHTAWDQLLKRYVKDGLVNYGALQTERVALERYLASLQEIDPAQWSSREARLAFWINAYNACVVKGVLDHDPVKSVKEVRGFFDRLRYRVAGRNLTLNEIEREGRALGDWRIHVAVVCASSSCPPLRAEAYLPERLHDQLTEHTTQFLNDPRRGLRVEGSTLWLSKIFEWYAADFLPTSQRGPLGRLTPDTLLPVIAPYLDHHVAWAIQHQQLEIKFLDYDWSLNAKQPASSR